MAEDTAGQSPRDHFTRDPDFQSLYANNVRLEASVWDLKLVFGQLELSSNPPGIEQHTAITLPWLQAKIMAYILEINLMLFETQNGHIMVPPSVMPPIPDPSLVDPNSPASEFILQMSTLLHRKYFSISMPPDAENPSPTPPEPAPTPEPSGE